VILADTSVWIDHFRQHNARLAARLDEGVVAVHEWVIGELACGGLRHRTQVLQLMRTLPAVPTASFGEVLHLIERRELMGRGIGWTDAHLLAGCVLGGARLWSRDARLQRVAADLGVASSS
jgi:predicted nucleic acid-binding protein